MKKCIYYNANGKLKCDSPFNPQTNGGTNPVDPKDVLMALYENPITRPIVVDKNNNRIFASKMKDDFCKSGKCKCPYNKQI